MKCFAAIFQLVLSLILEVQFVYGTFNTPFGCFAGFVGDPSKNESCIPCSGSGVYCGHNSTVVGECPLGYYCPDTTIDDEIPAHCNCELLTTTPSNRTCGALTGSDSFTCTDQSCTIEKLERDVVQWIGGESSTGECIGNSCLWKDFEMAATVQLHESTGDYNMAGITFRAQIASESGSFYGYHVSISYLQRVLRMETFLGRWSQYRTWEVDAPMVQLGRGHRLHVLVSGTTLQASIDGHLLLTKHDLHEFSSGTIGLYSYRQPATWSQLRVSQLSCSVPCPVGTFNSALAQTSSTACQDCSSVASVPAGRYYACGSDIAATTAHAECPVGFYCTGGGLAPPDKCPDSTSRPGATAQTDCTGCPAGWDCDGDGTALRPCPPGHYCPAGSTKAAPVPCPLGTHNPLQGAEEAGACQPCDTGHYGCNVVGAIQQRPCPTGHRCPAAPASPPACSCRPSFPGSCGAEELAHVEAGHLSPSWERFPVYQASGAIADYPLDLAGGGFFLEATRWMGGAWHDTCRTASCRWTDLGARFQLTLHAPFQHRVGFLFRQQSAFPLRGYALTFSVSSEPHQVAFARYLDGAYTALATSPVALEPGRSYLVELNITGNVFTAAVNGSQVLQFADAADSFPTGTIGVTAALQTASISHLRVWGAELPCDALSGTPQPCPPGSFQDDSGSTECRPCPAQALCSVAGLEAPGACPSGYECRHGEPPRECVAGLFGRDGTCRPCDVGSFTNSTGQGECALASPGTFVSEEGANHAEECGEGTFSELFGAVECTPCPANTMLGSLGGRLEQECTPCELHEYAPLGSAACRACNATLHYNITVSACTEESVRVTQFVPFNLCEQALPPLEEETRCTYVPYNSHVGRYCTSLTAISAAVAAIVTLAFVLLRENVLVRSSQWRMSVAICLCTMASSASITLLLGEPSETGGTRCALGKPLVHLSLATQVYLYDMYAAQRLSLFRNKKVPTRKMNAKVLSIGIFVVETVLVMIWLITGPSTIYWVVNPYIQTTLDNCQGCILPGEYECQTTTIGRAFQTISFLFIIGLSAIGCSVSWKTRNHEVAYHDGHRLCVGLGIVTTTLLFLIVVDQGEVGESTQEHVLFWAIGLASLNSVSIILILGYTVFKAWSTSTTVLEQHLEVNRTRNGTGVGFLASTRNNNSVAPSG